MTAIANFLKGLLISAIAPDLLSFYEVMYSGLGRVAGDVTIIPSGWLGGSVWGFMKQIEVTVMLPSATMIITFILACEVYHVVIEKNAMKDPDMPALFMIFFKLIVSVFVISNASDIVIGLFDLGNWAVEQTIGIIPLAINEPAAMTVTTIEAMLNGSDYNLVDFFGLWMTLSTATLAAHAINIVASLVVYGRLLQMVVYACFAPIPLATFMNRDWNIGQNYIKNLMALAFQGFLIVFFFGAYSIIVVSPINPTLTGDMLGDFMNITIAIWGNVGWGILLCMMLMKTHSITQSIFGAH